MQAEFKAAWEALKARTAPERLAKSACLRLFTLIQGVARWLQPANASLDRVKLPLLGAKRSFRMGVAGWRFAHGKRNLSGRAGIVAVLEVWPAICSVMVAVGSMIMIGIMLYNELQQ